MSEKASPVAASRPTPTGVDRPLAEELTDMLTGRLPGTIGMRILAATAEQVVGELPVQERVLAPNGYLHAASVVALADTACGIGTRLALPADATGFTTVELKTNYLGTARSGVVTATAVRMHGGRRTQIWDATVRDDQGSTIALFRCTQLIFHP
ncbi:MULTISPECIES: PaaI family thioesterase [Nocardia]|uniref:PaaI family thioesterase n=1 Tax=Nocardia TaxID=1817 RepID=UPI00293159AB|nr:PaaI family thioesterase [Nocardia canadensis]